MTDFSILRSRLTGTLTTPDDTAGVDAFNSTIRHRPDAVVRVASEPDVVEIVRFGRAEGLPLQLHATGHRAEHAYDSGVLLGVSALDSVAVDPDARTAIHTM